MKQRILSLLLAISLVLSLFTTGAWAAEAEPPEAEPDTAESAPEETAEAQLPPEEDAQEPITEAPASETGDEHPAEAAEYAVTEEETVTEAPMLDGEPQSYGLCVGGVEVTSANAGAILQDEEDNVTAEYDPASHTLTLTNAVLPAGGEYAAIIDYVCYNEDVTLTVTGSATLGGENCTNSGISVSGCNLRVEGTGSGIAYTGSGRGVSCHIGRPDSRYDFTGGSLTLKGTVSLTSTRSDAVFATYDVTVEDGSDLTALSTAATESGIRSWYGPITIEGGTVNAKGCCGIRLYMNNSTERGHIFIEGGTVTAIGTGGEGSYTNGSGCGIYSWYGIAIEGGTVTARSESTGQVYDSYGLNTYKGGLEITNDIVSVTASSNPEAEISQAIRCYPLTLGDRLSLLDPVNGSYGSSTIYLPDSNTPATACTLVPGTTPMRFSLTGAMLTLDQSFFSYTGEACKPHSTVALLADNTELTEGVDYTLSYIRYALPITDRTPVEPVEANRYYVVATGIGGYSGECTADFTIQSICLSSAVISITGIADKVYTGSPITQTPKVVVNGRTLVQGKEYKISYTNNTEVGTATYSIYPWGGAYRGSFGENGSGTFQILPKPVVKVNQKMTLTPPASLVKGKSVKLTIKNAVGAVSVKSSNPAIASVSGTTIRGLKPGTVTITVRAAGDKTRNSATKTFKLTIYPLVTPAVSKVENVSGGVKVTAQKLTGAVKYRFFVRKGTGNWARAGDSATNIFTWKKAVHGVQYSFSACCLDKNGKVISDYSRKQEHCLSGCPHPEQPRRQDPEGGLEKGRRRHRL